MSTDYTKNDGFSVAEKSGNNLIVGKMLKFTIDGKYKVDKTDTFARQQHTRCHGRHHRVGQMGRQQAD